MCRVASSGEGSSEGPPLCGREGPQVVGQYLDADVIGAGVAVLLDPRRDRCLVSPHDEGVDETVAAAVGDVVVGEALPLPVVDIVGEPEIGPKVHTCDVARL